MKCYLFVVLCLGAYAGIAVGIRCYVCSSSNTNQACEAFSNSNTPIQSDCSMCGFSTSLYGTGIYEKTIWTRTCTKVGGLTGNNGVPSVCTKTDTNGIAIDVCICDADLCNANKAKALASGAGQSSGAKDVAAKVSITFIVAVSSTMFNKF